MKKRDQVRKAEPTDNSEAEEFEREANRWTKFGEWMQEERNRLKMNQTTAAHKAGMSRVQWSRLESGDATKSTTIPRIARALGYFTGEEIDYVRELAGFGRLAGRPSIKLPSSLRHFNELPRELQEDVGRYVQRLYELEQLKKEKRAKK